MVEGYVPAEENVCFCKFRGDNYAIVNYTESLHLGLFKLYVELLISRPSSAESLLVREDRCKRAKQFSVFFPPAV